MRSVMQLGIMTLIFTGAFILMSAFFYQILPETSDTSVIALLTFLNILSTITLVFGLFIAIVIIFGRTVFGLTD